MRYSHRFSFCSVLSTSVILLLMLSFCNVVPAQQPSLTELEDQFIVELKLMRKDPAAYAKQNLDPMINNGRMNGSKWTHPVPGTNLTYGYSDVNLREIIIEASNQLKNAPKNMPVTSNAELKGIAKAFSKDWSLQNQAQYVPHVDSQGRGMRVRYLGVIGSNRYSENTVNLYLKSGSSRQGYGKLAMMAWLVDDFAASRGHRLALINPELTHFGMGFEINGDLIYGTLGMVGGVPVANNPVPANLNSTPTTAANIKGADEFWIVNRTTNLVLVAKNGVVVMEPKSTKQESLWRLRKGIDPTYHFVNVKTGKLLGTDWKTEPKLVPKLFNKGELIEWDLRTIGLLRLTSLGGEPLIYHENRLDWAISTRDPRINSGGKWDFVINR
ncbi:Cysteine-rich secretory protein family protein [Rubinisphaera italica]|uniref:Cysteine-rich secretory protein family protein n=2 Tax=Rubinisphaera italica TaxID=2527969 RepID=A0A5C5XF20_9PLAN|nr:Cysteine-rich secretory protein family protein [Rubinisphaera italica]